MRPYTDDNGRPYASDTYALYFQHNGPLRIHRELLLKSAKLASQIVPPGAFGSSLNTLYLDDVSLDVGHVLVHFLVTGDYGCLKPQGESLGEKIASEFGTALRVCAAAESFQLPSLCELAEKEMRRLGDELSLTSVIDVMEEAGPTSIHTLEVATYLESRMQSFWGSLTRIAAEEVLAELGTPNTISKLILKSVAQIKNSELPGEKELREEVHEEEPVAAETCEVSPSDRYTEEPPTECCEVPEAEPAPAEISEAEPATAEVPESEPQDEPRTAEDVMEKPVPMAQSSGFGVTGGGQFLDSELLQTGLMPFLCVSSEPRCSS